MAGLKRLHPWLPVFVAIVALFFGHFYGSYMVKGLGEVTVKLSGLGAPVAWSIFWVLVGGAFIFRGAYRPIEIVFYVFLGMLSLSLIGVAAWSGPKPCRRRPGILLFDIPEQNGPFGAILVVTSLIGAVGGSIANLLYPYFIQQKGWQGPRYRRLQQYDIAFGTAVILFLNLSVWTIGAELLHPRGITVSSLRRPGQSAHRRARQFGRADFLSRRVRGALQLGDRRRDGLWLYGHRRGGGRPVERNDQSRAAEDQHLMGLSRDRRMVPVHAADLDAARHARLHRADAARQTPPPLSCFRFSAAHSGFSPRDRT